jgi:hypothetical protein
MELTEKQIEEMKRVQQYFPFRIVWASVNKETGVFEVQASVNRRALNAAVRSGLFEVFSFQKV